ncbi:hypothetical protein [Actinomycetospora flava]|uniref:DUF5753 domain-containing protein n=1 Tax=Actinomycetospora flava TaxID=3129232 RepID=A0ABU8M9D0_9PSEU
MHSLPTAVISLIKEQAAVRGLYRDPLPEVTHAVRTEVVTGTTGWFGRGRERRRATELLLTPDVLVVTDRDPDAPDADAQVTFYRLAQLDVARIDGAEPGLELVGTPVGATERGARVVETDGGPEVDRFHRALLAASEDSRRIDVPSSRMPAESEGVRELF